MIKVKLVVAWFDFWIGFYYDRKMKVLYFLPIPCVGLAITLKKFKNEQLEDGRQITSNVKCPSCEFPLSEDILENKEICFCWQCGYNFEEVNT